MAAYKDAWRNHCFNRSNPTMTNLQSEQGKHVQLQAQTSFLLPSLLFSATSNLLSTCLSGRNEPVSFLLSSAKKCFPSHFQTHLTVLMFFYLFCSVRGGRWAFGSRGKQLAVINFQHISGVKDILNTGNVIMFINQ